MNLLTDPPLSAIVWFLDMENNFPKTADMLLLMQSNKPLEETKMPSRPKKRTLILFSLVLMLASLACLCTSGITDLIADNVPEEITIVEEPLAAPEISEPLEAPEEPQADNPSPGESSTSSSGPIEIIDANYYEDDFGSFNFLILVENTGDVGLEFVEASVTLKDSAGNIVANENFYSTVDLVVPGGRAPISLYWSDGVPEWDTYEIFVEGDEESDFFSYYTDMEVTSSELSEDDFGGYEIIGEVQNTGGLAAEFVTIVAILYDADGRIVGEGFTFADADVMQPGDTSPYTLFVFSTAGEVATYELIAEGSEVSE